MGLQLEDGKGSGAQAQVNSANMLMTFSASILQPEYNSWSKADSYMFCSSYSASQNDVVIYLKNTDPEKQLHISRLSIGSSASTLWTLLGSATGTASGSTLTPRNMNLTSFKTANMSCYGGAAVTGTSAGIPLGYCYTLANTNQVIYYYGGLILGYSNNISLSVGAAGTVAITIIGYFEQNVLS